MQPLLLMRKTFITTFSITASDHCWPESTFNNFSCWGIKTFLFNIYTTKPFQNVLHSNKVLNGNWRRCRRDKCETLKLAYYDVICFMLKHKFNFMIVPSQKGKSGIKKNPKKYSCMRPDFILHLAEVTLHLSALKWNACLNQLINFALQGLEIKKMSAKKRGKTESEWGAGTTHTQTRGIKEEEKNGSVTFPNILFGSWRRRGNHR